MKQPMTHVWIPDTQVKPGVRTDHLEWAGRYVADHLITKRRPVRIIHSGDHWDFPSLSSYDRGKSGLMEGRRIRRDIDAGNAGFVRLDDPIAEAAANSDSFVDKVLLRGNHEDRLTRALEADATLDGLVSFADLDSRDWQVVPYLKPITFEGVAYAHYFYNPMSGKPYGGQSMDTRLKTLGFSFVMGHQQTFMYGERYLTNGQVHHGLVAGAFYLHDEDYLGPQGNMQWRGIVVLHEVADGKYDIMKVSLEYLCQRYAGVTLNQFRWRKYAR